MIISHSNFIENESDNYQGAMMLNGPGIDYINISESNIVRNTADIQAGIFVGTGDHVIIHNCRVDSNLTDGGNEAGISINNNDLIEISNSKISLIHLTKTTQE